MFLKNKSKKRKKDIKLKIYKKTKRGNKNPLTTVPVCFT